MNEVNQKLIDGIAQKYSLELLLLFGSRAGGQSYKGSDFDVAYLSRKDLGLKTEANLILDLGPLLKSEDIDLVNLKKAPPLLFYAVFNNCKVLFEKDPLLFFNMKAYAFKKYVESKPLYEEKIRKLQKEIKGYKRV